METLHHLLPHDQWGAQTEKAAEEALCLRM